MADDGDERSREEQTADVLLIETSESIRTLTLNRPRVRNALSTELRDKLFDALAEAEADDAVDVVILTGSDPAFCAGIDLKEISTRLDASGGNGKDLSTPRWPSMSTPVIGAINGVCVTGGFELALSCDILIASENARFADTHARVGLLPGWGMSVRLPEMVGRGLAYRMSLTGDYLGAYDALRVGLVTEVVLHDELIDAARAVATSIVNNNREAVQALLASYHRIDAAQTREAWAIEHESSENWLQTNASSEDIAANREAVIKRGRSQIH